MIMTNTHSSIFNLILSRLLPLLVFMVIAFADAFTQKRDIHHEDWSDLFNGVSLDGWDIKITGYDLNDNALETFRVENGVLKVDYSRYDTFDDRFGHIFYEEPFSHYRLVVEYRFVGEQTPGGPGWAYRNNGIMFHSQSASSMERDQRFPVSIEFQLLGGDGEQDRPNGSICTPGTHVVVDGTLQTSHCIDSGGPTHHGDKWVRAELVVHGDSSARHILNGESVIEYSGMQLEDGTPLSSGFIALQAESHPTHFRKISILNLKGCMDPEAINFKSYYVADDPDACVY